MEEARAAAAFFADCVQNGSLPFVLAVVWKENGELIGDTGVNEVEGKRDGELTPASGNGGRNVPPFGFLLQKKNAGGQALRRKRRMGISGS